MTNSSRVSIIILINLSQKVGVPMNLTKPQKLIYEMEKFYGGAISVVAGSILIDGKTDSVKINNAVNQLLKNNEVLRTRILEKDNNATQEVVAFKEQEFEILEFQTEDEFKNYAKTKAREPLDLTGSLCDIKIIVLPEKYGLFARLHHIISDAWTLSLMGTQFNKIMCGEAFEAFSYCDCIETEESYTNSKRYEKDKEFFIEQFKKCDEATFLNEKQISTLNAERKTFVISKDKAEIIRAFAKNNSTSEFILFLNALSSYVNRTKLNTEKFYIGTAVLNRSNFKEKNTMGMFINTVPLLIELENEKSFKENLESVEKTVFSVFRHQKFNYGDVLKTLRQEFDFQEKLYDVMLSYQNATVEGKSFETEWYHCGSQSESLQIHIDDRDNEGIFKIHYDYLTEKFTENEIERLNSHILNLLFDGIENGNKKLYELNILSETEKNKLLFEFNDTKVDYPKDKCVHELFEERVKEHPDKIAVIACDKTLTYKELNEEANRIAHSLIEKGVKVGDIVAFALPRRSYLISTMLGILKAGAAYMPIDPDYPKDRIEYMANQNKVVAFINDENIKEFLSNEHTGNTQVKTSIENYFCVLHTSGSTGNPKGAIIFHKNMINFTFSNQYLLNNIDTVIAINTVTFDVFEMDTIFTLISSKLCVLASEEQQYNQASFEAMMSLYKNCLFWATPTKMTNYINNSKTGEFVKNINCYVVGGEVLKPELLDKIRKLNSEIKIYTVYGPTETLIYSTLVDVSNTNDITIGHPIDNTQIYILDAYKNITPLASTGELCIAGDGVGAGYLNRPELTAEKFITNPFGEGKLYKTGDLVYWREDGNIAFVGRNDFQVKIRGLRIELGEIENALCSIDEISQAVVVVRKNNEGRQLICAFYTGKELETKEIRNHIGKKLPKYMLPHIFTHLSEMPLTSSGKVNRKTLPEIDLENIVNDAEFVAPQTTQQKELCKLVEAVLSTSPVGIEDDFFDLGGDSLKAIELVSKAHTEGIYFALQNVFDYPTVRELCEFIENGDKQTISFNDIDFSEVNKILEKNTTEYISEPKKCEVGNILLAGATGYLGIHILADFLDNDNGTAYCFVRGNNEEDSSNRLQDLLVFYFGNKYETSDRIKVICADLQKDKFGLQEAEYNDLLDKVDTVINCAASVKHYGSYKYFYEANVETTKKLIEFCKLSDAKLIHTSTLSVSGNSFGDDFDGVVSENELHFYENTLYINQPLENVYARSKFEAEKAVLDAMSDGLQANIMRMGNLTNRLSDGKFQKNYESNAFLQRLKAVLELKIFPEYLMKLYAEFTPIDEAANAVMTIARHFSTEQNVFHINSIKVLYFDKLLKIFNNLGFTMETVEGETFTNALRATAKQTGLEHIFETFINDMDENDQLNYDSNIRIENDFTVEYLKSLGFEWSDIDFEYMRKYIEYFKGINYLE